MENYKIELIAGGVIKDADGNIVDDSSHRIAVAKTVHAEAYFEATIARAAVEDATARVIQASLEVAEAVMKAQEADVKVTQAANSVIQIEAAIAAERNGMRGR